MKRRQGIATEIKIIPWLSLTWQKTAWSRWRCQPWNSTVRYRSWTSIQDLFHPNSWQKPVAAVTVYSAPDAGRKGRPKHVEHTCSC